MSLLTENAIKLLEFPAYVHVMVSVLHTVVSEMLPKSRTTGAALEGGTAGDDIELYARSVDSTRYLKWCRSADAGATASSAINDMQKN